jgi:hypothetical protein
MHENRAALSVFCRLLDRVAYRLRMGQYAICAAVSVNRLLIQRRERTSGPLLAFFRHGAMSDLSPLCEPKQPSADPSKFKGSRPRRALINATRFRHAWTSVCSVARVGEERRAGMGRREIEQAIVGSRRIAYKHPLQHFLDHPEIAGIADKIGSEFLSSWSAEGHVVAQDVILVSIGVDDGERIGTGRAYFGGDFSSARILSASAGVAGL